MSRSRTIAKSVAWTRAARLARGARRRSSAVMALMAAAPWGVFALASVLFTVATSIGTPHLRWSGAYLEGGAERRYTHCRYIGIAPFTHVGERCPLVVWRRLPVPEARQPETVCAPGESDGC